jgi:REP element-mobilizing transposase RayT
VFVAKSKINLKARGKRAGGPVAKASSNPTIGKQLSLKEQAPLGSKERAQLNATFTPRTSHGGNRSKGKRKTSRPFFAKTPLHLVLKSDRAKGEWSLLHRKHKSKITSMIYVYAKRFKVRVINSANVGNHLHLLVKAEEKKNLADFLRVLAGRIAVTVTGARKYVKRIGKFWSNLYWSRLINWGRDFFHTHQYITCNLIEAMPIKNAKIYKEMMKKAKIISNVDLITGKQKEPPPDDLDELLETLVWE